MGVSLFKGEIMTDAENI